MEVFADDMIIRLKNNKDKYLVAEQDEVSVSKSRDGSTKNAQWTIKVNDDESLYLKSCYGKYLTASNKPSIPGLIAKNLRVTQTSPEKKNTSHQWLPATVSRSGLGEAHSVWFKTPHGSYLQTHTGRNLITHDLLRKHGPDPLNEKILWQVEIVGLPTDQCKHSESVTSKMLFHAKTFVSEKRKDNGLKDEKEAKKGRFSKNILSRKLKLNSKSC